MGRGIAQRQVLFTLTDEQLAELKALAADAELPVQQLMELKIFGRIRPRYDPRAPRKRVQAEELPIAG